MTIKLTLNQFKKLYSSYEVQHPINIKGRKLAIELAHILNARPIQKKV